MHSIICFGSFLFLINLLYFFWFFCIDNFELFKLTITASIAAFVLYFTCFALYCFSVYGNFKSFKTKDKEGFLTSFLVLFFCLLLIVLYFHISLTSIGQGAYIAMVAVIPAVIATFILYCLYVPIFTSVTNIARSLIGWIKK